MGHLGCLVGFALVTSLVFRDADLLDKQRWKRYWHGDLLGYAVSFILLLGSLNPDSGAQSVLLVYVYACVIGFGVGLCNVARTDKRDKTVITDRLRRFAESAASDSVEAATGR